MNSVGAILITGIIIVGFMCGLAVQSLIEEHAKNEACIQGSYISHNQGSSSKNGIDMCEDKDGNLFYVKMECESGFFTSHCKEHKITVN